MIHEIFPSCRTEEPTRLQLFATLSTTTVASPPSSERVVSFRYQPRETAAMWKCHNPGEPPKEVVALGDRWWEHFPNAYDAKTDTLDSATLLVPTTMLIVLWTTTDNHMDLDTMLPNPQRQKLVFDRLPHPTLECFVKTYFDKRVTTPIDVMQPDVANLEQYMHPSARTVMIPCKDCGHQENCTLIEDLGWYFAWMLRILY